MMLCHDIHKQILLKFFQKLPTKKKNHQVQVNKKLTCIDEIYKELAARDSDHNIHGEMSEYLTKYPTIRTIYPPPAAHQGGNESKAKEQVSMDKNLQFYINL